MKAHKNNIELQRMLATFGAVAYQDKKQVFEDAGITVSRSALNSFSYNPDNPRYRVVPKSILNALTDYMVSNGL